MLRTAFALFALALTANVAAAQTADGRLNTIKKTNTIKIAYRTNATPFSYANENKEPAGYTVDLCKLVVLSLEKQLGVQALKIQWIPVNTSEMQTVISLAGSDLEGSADIVLGNDGPVSARTRYRSSIATEMAFIWS